MKRIRSHILWIAVMATLLTTVGCGGNVKMAPVGGQVTMNGKAVTGIFVVFAPQANGEDMNASTRPAMAAVDAEGRYQLSTNTEGDGAAVGLHKVTVVSVNRNAQPPGFVPQESELVEVKPDDNSFDFALKPSR